MQSDNIDNYLCWCLVTATSNSWFGRERSAVCAIAIRVNNTYPGGIKRLITRDHISPVGGEWLGRALRFIFHVLTQIPFQMSLPSAAGSRIWEGIISTDFLTKKSHIKYLSQIFKRRIIRLPCDFILLISVFITLEFFLQFYDSIIIITSTSL